MTNYSRGAAFERQLKQEEEEAGAIWAGRTAGSHGLFDVVAVYPDGSVTLIQAKLGRITRGERERLEAWARTAPENCTVVLVNKQGREVISA